MNALETIPQLFFNSVEQFHTKRAALRYKANGEWRDITHQQLARRVHHAALGLREMGIQPGDRVAILSANRPEWAFADFGCLNAGITDVAIYPTLPPHQIRYLLEDSGSRLVFVENETQLAKVTEIRSDLPTLEHVVIFEEVETPHAMAFSRLLALGNAAESKYASYREDALAIPPDQLATLIYTSGTTGDPKGVMLSHGNLTSNVLSAVHALPLGSSDSCLSLLPLSHSFERTAGFYAMFYGGATINYAESIDALMTNISEVRPTIMLSVPRLFEKIYARALEAALSGGAVKKRIFFWARRIGGAWADATLNGEAVSAGLALQRSIADRLVFSKLRKRTGGRLRYFVSGGAPLAPEIARFFHAARLPVLEGYGLTETSPVITVNPYTRPKIGTVGPAIAGVEVRIAEDGEILARGPNVMQGYFNKPEATAEAIDGEGWFHTGDLGELDEDGYLSITDRKKDIIVTAGGKKIAPQAIENRVKSSSFVHNAVMLGDRRKFAIILAVPDLAACAKWARSRNLAIPDQDNLLDVPEVAAKVEREVMVNLRDLARFEMPKKILLIKDDFTEERGELTPKMSVKRRVVEDHYRDRIEAAYAEPAEE